MAVQLIFTPNYAFAEGVFAPGAKVSFFLSGTTTPQTVYSDEALTVAHPVPLVADASGQFATVWADNGLNIKAVVTDADDSTIATYDPVVLGNISSGDSGTTSFTPIPGNGATTVQQAITNNTTLITNGFDEFFEIPPLAGNDGKLVGIVAGAPAYVDRNEVLLQSTSLSGLGEVAFTAFNSALYSDYIFSFSGAIVASAASLLIHTSSDGGANYDEGASDYANWKSISTTSSTTATVTANATFGSMSFVNAPQSPGAMNGDLTLYNAGEAIPTSIEGILVSSLSTLLQRQSIVGMRLASEAVNGVRFDLSSPSTTWTAGTLRVIGVRK